MNDKVKDLKTLSRIVSNLKKEGKTIVFTNGCFDILHIGHVRYLQEARTFGDILVVGVNSDVSVRKLKGADRPIVPESERAEVLAALDCVDYVTIFVEDNPEKVLGILEPQIDIKGGDYKIENMPEAKLVKSYGGKTIVVSEIKGSSTTKIIDKIMERSKNDTNT